MVCKDDALLSLSHHGPVNRSLVRIVRSESVFSMGADCTLGLDVCARLSLDGTGAGCTLMMDAL